MVTWLLRRLHSTKLWVVNEWLSSMLSAYWNNVSGSCTTASFAVTSWYATSFAPAVFYTTAMEFKTRTFFKRMKIIFLVHRILHLRLCSRQTLIFMLCMLMMTLKKPAKWSAMRFANMSSWRRIREGEQEGAQICNTDQYWSERWLTFVLRHVCMISTDIYLLYGRINYLQWTSSLLWKYKLP